MLLWFIWSFGISELFTHSYGFFILFHFFSHYLLFFQQFIPEIIDIFRLIVNKWRLYLSLNTLTVPDLTYIFRFLSKPFCFLLERRFNWQSLGIRWWKYLSWDVFVVLYWSLIKIILLWCIVSNKLIAVFLWIIDESAVLFSHLMKQLIMFKTFHFLADNKIIILYAIFYLE